MLRAMAAPNIPGPDAVAWFDRLPSLHDAEILSIHLNRRGPSILRVHARNVVDAGPVKGGRDAIVVFEFEGIRRLRLEGEEPVGASVVHGMKLRVVEQGYLLELSSSRGIGGEIVADAVAVRIEG